MEPKKRKISIRKILQLLLTIVVSAGCIVAIVSASRIEGDKYLSDVVVHIKNDKKYHFIEQKQIMDMAINNRHVDVMHTPLARLDVHGIERVIKSDPWVAEAQAFIDIDRVLHMYVTERIPVARVFQADGSSYYMDATLNTMPLSETNIYYTTVVTNVPQLENDSAAANMRKRMYAMVRTIQMDTFWNAQISQVIVDSLGMFELTPVLGNHRILFGDATDIRLKLDNLFAFYKNVLNRIGWDKYEVLDLRFQGQVVASPSLPYKGPVDKAIDKMNWINSIVITEAQNDMRDSLKATDINGLTAGAASGASTLPHAMMQEKAPVKPISKTATVVTKTVILPKEQRKSAAASKAALLDAKKKANAKQAVPAKAQPMVKPPTAPAGKGTVVAKPVVKTTLQAKQQPGLKPPSAPAGKGTIKAQPAGKAKAGQKKAPAKAKDKKPLKPAAKPAKTKPAEKKTDKPAEAKKDTKITKEKSADKAAPKYAYPESKEH